MPVLVLRSPSEQVAAHLRGELGRGIWRGTMPGVPRLAAELGIDPKTAEAALAIGARAGVELPITQQMGDLIAGRTTARSALEDLMLRPQRIEVDAG